MARKTSRAKPRRQPLSRDRVLLAALRLVDKAGVASLSMRGLAQTLGVEAMSLYKHVANKDEVLDGLIDLVVTEITVPPLGTEWRHAMRERAISARHVFLRHPWAAVLMESRLMQSPVRLHYGDSVLGLLRHGGFTVPMAYRAFLLIDSYLYGFIMQEVNWPFDEADIPQVAEAMTAQMSPADHPHLVEVTGHVMTMSVEGKFGGVYDAEFTAGLELILDSLARLRDTLGPQSSVSESATVSADVVPRENQQHRHPHACTSGAVQPLASLDRVVTLRDQHESQPVRPLVRPSGVGSVTICREVASDRFHVCGT